MSRANYSRIIIDALEGKENTKAFANFKKVIINDEVTEEPVVKQVIKR